jgi:aspartyl aminopeptidase
MNTKSHMVMVVPVQMAATGRVLVREGSKLVHKLVRIEKPILRIPMLAIHLNRGLYTDGFKPNFQTNLQPILATSAKVSTLLNPYSIENAAHQSIRGGLALG